MKHYLILLGAITLAGCSTVVPVKQKWPDAIPELQESCPELKTISGDKVAITDMLKVVIENYTTYYQCSNKVDGWNDWYKKQKEVFEKANK